jgi:hypothetical protein
VALAAVGRELDAKADRAGLGTKSTLNMRAWIAVPSSSSASGGISTG